MTHFPSNLLSFREANDLLAFMSDEWYALDGNPWVLQFAAAYKIEDLGVYFRVWRRIEASTFRPLHIHLYPDSENILWQVLDKWKRTWEYENEAKLTQTFPIRFGTKK